MKENTTVVFTGLRQVVVETRDVPKPAAGEMLVQSLCTLISTGTELSILNCESAPGSMWSNIANFPYIPGYDNIGEVVEVGEGVDSSWVGKKVGSFGRHAQYAIVKPEFARPIHRDIPDEHAVFFTLAELVMNGVRRGDLQWGETAVVFGVGLLGQLAVRFCRICGAKVIAVDTADSRLDRLPDDVGIIRANPTKDDLTAVVKKATKDRMADVVYEITGNGELLPTMADLLHPVGRLVILGCPKKPTLFDFHDQCNWPSISIIGAHNRSHPAVATVQNPWTNHRHAEMFFDYVADGEMDLAPLISKRAVAADAPAIYAEMIQDRSKEMGVIFDWTK